jgi:hypothetical protein
LTLSTVVFALYVFGHASPPRAEPGYAAGASLVLLAIALVFNIVGMKTGKWVPEHRRARTVDPVGGTAPRRPDRLCSHPARRRRCLRAHSSRTSPRCRPCCSSRISVSACRTGARATMAGEVVEPRKTFPRAIVISGLSIAAVYLTERSRSSGRCRQTRSRSSPA